MLRHVSARQLFQCHHMRVMRKYEHKHIHFHHFSARRKPQRSGRSHRLLCRHCRHGQLCIGCAFVVASGHYRTYRVVDDSVMLFDDSHVRRVDVWPKNGYMFLYVRRDVVANADHNLSSSACNLIVADMASEALALASRTDECKPVGVLNTCLPKKKSIVDTALR